MIMKITKNDKIILTSCCNNCNNKVVVTLEDIQGVETLKWWGFQNLWWQPEASGFEEELMVVHCEPNMAIVKVREVKH